MESPSERKSLSQCMNESRQQRLEKATIKLNEIEEWLLDNPFDHADYQTNVEERNNLIHFIN